MYLSMHALLNRKENPPTAPWPLLDDLSIGWSIKTPPKAKRGERMQGSADTHSTSTLSQSLLNKFQDTL